MLGPSITRENRYLDCQGVNTIAGSLKEQSLKEVNKELRKFGLVDQHTPLPRYAAGGSVGVLVGIQDVQLDPVLIAVLPSSIGIYRCPFVDMWGSQIAYAGPHPSFNTPYCQQDQFMRLLRAPSNSRKEKKRNRESRRNLFLCHFAPPGCGDGNAALGAVRHRQHRQQPDITQALPGL